MCRQRLACRPTFGDICPNTVSGGRSCSIGDRSSRFIDTERACWVRGKHPSTRLRCKVRRRRDYSVYWRRWTLTIFSSGCSIRTQMGSVRSQIRHPHLLRRGGHFSSSKSSGAYTCWSQHSKYFNGTPWFSGDRINRATRCTSLCTRGDRIDWIGRCNGRPVGWPLSCWQMPRRTINWVQAASYEWSRIWWSTLASISKDLFQRGRSRETD